MHDSLSTFEIVGVGYSTSVGESTHRIQLTSDTLIKISRQEHDNQICIMYERKEEPGRINPAFGFLPIQPGPLDDVCARPYDPSWVSIDILKQWLRHCDNSHGDDCQSLTYIPIPIVPINLIDLENMRLVTVTGKQTYVVLSYVWGNVETLQTTKANFEKFQEVNALNPESESLRIPETIKDAMRLTNALGQRYLWVDALCIIQDQDAAEKQAQLDVMGSIYAHAYLTIVASQGKDASHGLRGATHRSKPRNIACHMARFPGLQPLQLHKVRLPGDPDSQWVHRGWTYQESSLSRRMLIFSKDFADWSCKSAVWNEELIFCNNRGIQSNLMGKGGPGMLYTVRPWPCMPEWHKIAMEYCGRQLGFDSDAEPAFSGMLGVMSRFFHGGFHFAIPQMFFDIGLLWRPFMRMRRRQANGDGYAQNIPPSWSWLGWEGGLNCWDYIYCSDYIIQDPENPLASKAKVIITSLVQWTRVVDLHMGGQVATTPILNSYHKLRPRQPNLKGDLEPGWCLHSYPDDTRSQKHFYTHEETGNDVHFAYPVPLKNTSPEPSLWRSIRTPYLSFRTRRAGLCIGKPTKAAFEPFVIDYNLNNTKGDWVGLVQFHPFQDQSVCIETTTRVEEFIAISAGSAKNQADCSGSLPEWNLHERPKKGEFYEYVNVLLIKWKGNVAFRQGIGRVAKEAWEGEDTELVNVILG